MRSGCLQGSRFSVCAGWRCTARKLRFFFFLGAVTTDNTDIRKSLGFYEIQKSAALARRKLDLGVFLPNCKQALQVLDGKKLQGIFLY